MSVKTRAQLNSDADLFIPDNETALISEQDVRDRVKDLADSAFLSEDLDTSGGPADYDTTQTSLAAKLPLAGGEMSGNITMAGAQTVDGRDVSADGASLDTALVDISNLETSVAGKQPLDSDLTSIAALSTTSFGRGLLTSASASALRTSLSLVIGTDVQAFNTNLQGISGLTTTSYGRGLLELADDAALSAEVGAAGTLNLNNGGLTINRSGDASSAPIILRTDAAQPGNINWQTGTNNRWLLQKDNGAESGSNAGSDLQLIAYDDAGSSLGAVFDITRSTQVVDFKETPTVNGEDLAFAVAEVRDVVKDYGAAFDGSTDDLDEWNAAIAWLNGSNRRVLTAPPGISFISDKLDAITGSYKAVIGHPFATWLRMDGSSTEGQFFQIGDGGSTTTVKVFIEGFVLQVQNTSGVSGYAVVHDGTGDCKTEKIHLIGAAGAMDVGATASCARSTFRHWSGNYNDSLDHRLGRFQRWTGLKLRHIKIFGDNTGTTTLTVPTWEFPVSGLCDTLLFETVEVFSTLSAPTAINAVIDDGAMVNCWFHDCVFDKHGIGSAAIQIQSSASSSASGSDYWRAKNWWFINCRCDTGGDDPGGRAVRILMQSSTGFAEIKNINFRGCHFVYRDGPSFTTVQSGSDDLDGIRIIACTFAEAASSTVGSVIQMGGSGWQVIGCHCGFEEQSESSNTTSFVLVTADVDDFVVSGNTNVNATNTVKHYGSGYASASSNRIVVGNTGGADANEHLLGSYSVAGAPTASQFPDGALIRVSDGDAGSPCIAVSSGGTWKRIVQGATISAT